MAYENINFSNPHMTMIDGYFYMFDHSKDVLFAKTDDGSVAFSYPLNTTIDFAPRSLEYVNGDFWTLQQQGDPQNGVNIKRWSINGNGVVDVVDEFVYSNNYVLGPSIFEDDFDSATYSGTWNLFEDGFVTQSGGSVYPTDYGTGGSWHGPAIRHMFESTTSGILPTYSGISARFKWNLKSTNVDRMGELSFHFLDATGSLVFAVRQWDEWSGLTRSAVSVWDTSGSLYTNTNATYISQTDSNTTSISRRGDNLTVSINGTLVYDGVVVTDLIQGIYIKWGQYQTFNPMDDHSVEMVTVMSGGAMHNFDSHAFTVEQYDTTMSTTVSAGNSVINIDKYYNTVIISGTVLSLGPNTVNESEDVTVISVSGSDVYLESPLHYDYAVNDGVHFYNNLWLFNNYYGQDINSGGMFKFDAHTGNYITDWENGEFDNVTACTFGQVPDVFSSTVDTLLYVKGTNVKYLNINTLTNYGIMVIDNIQTDNATIIPVYDLVLSNNSLYRLQKAANYYGSDFGWALYNYVLSPVRRFINAVSVAAYPVILPANGYNVTKVTTLVNDQYGDGAVNKPVFFTDTDDVGFMLTNPAYTEVFFGTGEAISYYRAGVAVQTVTIEGTATQFD